MCKRTDKAVGLAMEWPFKAAGLTTSYADFSKLYLSSIANADVIFKWQNWRHCFIMDLRMYDNKK
jgi:hypothetical protein